MCDILSSEIHEIGKEKLMSTLVSVNITFKYESWYIL